MGTNVNSTSVITSAQVTTIIYQSNGNSVQAQQTLSILLQDNLLTDDARRQAEAFIQQCNQTTVNTNAQPMTDADAIRLLLQNFDSCANASGVGQQGLISRSDLQSIASSPTASPSLKAAAQRILDNFSMYDDAAGARGGQDGLISKADLQTVQSGDTMTSQRAIDTLRANFGKITDGDTFGLDDVAKKYEDPNTPPELKRACAYLMAHPELFKQLDTAGHGGSTDGQISMDDLNAGYEEQGMTGVTATETLLDNYNKLNADGSGLTHDNLKSIVEDGSSDPRVKAAAHYLLDHPDLMTQLNSGSNISQDDLRAYIKKNDPNGGAMTDKRCIDVLQANFDKVKDEHTLFHWGIFSNGTFGLDDVASAANDPSSSPELKQACQYMLAHPELFKRLDTASQGGSADGRVSMDDLKAGYDQTGVTANQACRTLMDNFQSLDDQFQPSDGLISKDNLQQIANDTNQPANVRAAARYFIDHPDAFNQLDTAAHGGAADGLFSRDDLTAYMQQHPDLQSGNLPGSTPSMPTNGGVSISFNPNNPNADPFGPQNPAFGDPFQNQIDEVLTDPTLTVEDQVTIFIELIMEKMDKQIEDQMRYINSLQQQQNQAGAKYGQAPQGPNGQQPNGQQTGQTGQTGQTAQTGQPGQAPDPTQQANGNNSPASNQSSIDIETLKLKRLIDKRSQLFDTLRQIIDKYNMTAKGIIDTIGR